MRAARAICFRRPHAWRFYRESALNDGPGLFRLMTLRTNDQFNTTVYGYDDRFRDGKKPFRTR
jgi:hypothetical protein